MAPLLPATHRHVVVAVDGSDDSKLAVLWAARHLLKPDDDLHLVMVSANAPLPTHVAACNKRTGVSNPLRCLRLGSGLDIN